MFEYCLQADRDIELLATVGSQVGFFGELGVLNLTDRLPDGKLSVPARLGKWYSYYDPDDALSFLAAPVFDRVADIEIDMGAVSDRPQRVLESTRHVREANCGGEHAMTADYDAALVIGIAHYPSLLPLQGPARQTCTASQTGCVERAACLP